MTFCATVLTQPILSPEESWFSNVADSEGSAGVGHTAGERREHLPRAESIHALFHLLRSISSPLELTEGPVECRSLPEC